MISDDKGRLVENILTSADRLFRQLLPTVPKDLLTLDVTMPQLKIMLMLYFHGAVRMTDIASGLDVTLPTATSLMVRLAEKNYVLRENGLDDRRVVLCRLSATGQKAINRIWASARTRSKELLEGMDNAKLQMFVEVLEAMMKSSGSIEEQTVAIIQTPEKKH